MISEPSMMVWIPRASNLNKSDNEFQVYIEMKRSGVAKKWFVVEGRLDLTTYKITKVF